MNGVEIVAPVLILILVAVGLRQSRNRRGKIVPSLQDRNSPDFWPHFVDGWEAVARWVRNDNRERVFLVRRPDGTYNTYAERFEIEPDYQSWIPVFGSSFYASEDVAKREIEAEWPWTRGTSSEKRKPNTASHGTALPRRP